MIWLHSFLDELGKKQEMGILHSNSHNAIFLAKNSAFHSNLKHIQMRYHFICYLVKDKLVILEKIYGSKNPIDMLTKGITIKKLKLSGRFVGHCGAQLCLIRIMTQPELILLQFLMGVFSKAQSMEWRLGLIGPRCGAHGQAFLGV